MQFQAILNGEIYQAEMIGVSGGNKTENETNRAGLYGLGDRTTRTELVFQKLGARNTDGGFKLIVQDEGLVLKSLDSEYSVQQELNKIMSQTNKSDRYS